MTLFFYGAENPQTAWQRDADRAKQAANKLNEILRQAVTDGFSRFVTALQTETDAVFARQAVLLRRQYPQLELILALVHADGMPAARAFAGDGTIVIQPPVDGEPRDVAALRNLTALLEEADMLVMPLESEPRPPLSVQLSRMALETGVALVMYDNRVIQPVRLKQVDSDEIV